MLPTTPKSARVQPSTRSPWKVGIYLCGATVQWASPARRGHLRRRLLRHA